MTDVPEIEEPVSVPAQPGTGTLSADTNRVAPARSKAPDDGDGVVLYEDAVLQILLSAPTLRLRLIGQAGLSHRLAIEQALRRIEQGASDVHVDLSGLGSIDVGGARQVIDHAGLLGIEGRNIRITGVRPNVLRIFQVCLWPKPSNLSIEDASGNGPTSASRRSLDGGGHGRPVPSR